MKPRRRSAGRLVGAGLALACLAALLPAAASAETPGYLPEAQQEAWAERLAEAQEAIGAARRRVARLEAAYAEAQHSNHPRGEARAELQQSLREARRELEAARRRLPELVEEARRAGVYPAVLRPYKGD